MIDTIISSSVLILIVLIIRAVFKGKINPIIQYGLWGLVAIRLAVFNLFDILPMKSTLSVMNAVGNVEATIRRASNMEQVLAGHADASAIDNAVLIMDNVQKGIMAGGEGIYPAAGIDWQLVLMIIWAVGAVALVLWFIHVNRKFGEMIYENRKFLMSVKADGNSDIAIDAKGINNKNGENKKLKLMPVYMVEGLDSPCLMGHKGEVAIYIPPQVAVDREMLRFSIAHELCHYKHHDLTWAIVRGGLLAFYWFNPLVWVAAIMSKRDCELACDYSVLKQIGKEERMAYGKTVVDLIRQGRNKRNPFQMATTMYGTKKGMKDRITMIATNKEMKNSALIAVLTIAILAAGCTFTTAPNDINGDNSSSTPRLIAGYMVIEGNLLYLDEVEILTREDTERIEELELELGENITMPSGYHIYNADTEKQAFEITKETTYTFYDYSFLFIADGVDDRLYTTSKKEEFTLHLNKSYSDSPPAQKVPFFIEVQDGKVINIKEEIGFTI